MAGGVQMAHIRQLVLDKLARDTAIQAIVANRVSEGYPERTADVEGRFPAIHVEWTGGFLHWLPVLSRPQFYVWCSSQVSSGQAVELYDLVVAALQNERLTIDGVPAVVTCQENTRGGRPADVYDPTTRTWKVRGRWIARAGLL